ncbi:MAG: antitoxin family protein [Candidatus Poribacteria bacterium]|nr:antitoxin family protein [Candidatus Poribacteria bacterium]
MTVITFKATYKNGVLTPSEKINLPEDAEVTVRVETADDVSEYEKTRRFHAAAGGWKGLYDWDAFLEETYEERSLDTRPDVEL